MGVVWGIILCVGLSYIQVTVVTTEEQKCGLGHALLSFPMLLATRLRYFPCHSVLNQGHFDHGLWDVTLCSLIDW